MTDPTTAPHSLDMLVQDLTHRITAVVQQLSAAFQQTPPTLPLLEEQVLRSLKELGGALLVGLAQLLVPSDPPPTHPCPGGASACFERLRPATCRTLLGPRTLRRPYYLCSACHHGFAPLDQQLGWCAGRRSAALDELLALLGATQDSFTEAASVLARLSLVELAPNTVRAATEELGQVLAEAEQAQIEALQSSDLPRSATSPASAPLCVSLDGVQAHLTPEGWKEVCVGVVYQVRPCRPSPDRRAEAVQAEALSYVGELGSRRDAFGWQLYAEARRRGAAQREVVVVGDGARWLWELAELHFPQATQIVDWYHATEYVWDAAKALWEADERQGKAWAEQQLSQMWDGKVSAVLAELERYPAGKEEVVAARTYFTNQQGRMNYPDYRARGLPVGSGTVESGCKQIVSSRLKGAGMIWGAEGARQVVKVRAWLKSGRWQEAMALRPRPQRRCYAQQSAEGQRVRAAVAGEVEAPKPEQVPARRGLSAEVLAELRDELGQKPAQHPWRRPWSRKQQSAAAPVPSVRPVPVSAV